jgi:hypothetical protein
MILKYWAISTSQAFKKRDKVASNLGGYWLLRQGV